MGSGWNYWPRSYLYELLEGRLSFGMNWLRNRCSIGSRIQQGLHYPKICCRLLNRTQFPHQYDSSFLIMESEHTPLQNSGNGKRQTNVHIAVVSTGSKTLSLLTKFLLCESGSSFLHMLWIGSSLLQNRLNQNQNGYCLTQCWSLNCLIIRKTS